MLTGNYILKPDPYRFRNSDHSWKDHKKNECEFIWNIIKDKPPKLYAMFINPDNSFRPYFELKGTLLNKEFCLDDNQNNIINNSIYLMIFGYQSWFGSKEELLNSINDQNIWKRRRLEYEYKKKNFLSRQIMFTIDLKKDQTKKKHLLVSFKSKRLNNDIIESIEFRNNRLYKIKTIQPLCLFCDHEFEYKLLWRQLFKKNERMRSAKFILAETEKKIFIDYLEGLINISNYDVLFKKRLNNKFQYLKDLYTD